MAVAIQATSIIEAAARETLEAIARFQLLARVSVFVGGDVLPISYAADRDRAERILLEAARRHSLPISQMSEEALREMQRRYVLQTPDLQPQVYFRLTDNWLELTVRFIVHDHGIRELKDAMSRDILCALGDAGIGLASTTFEIVGLPPLRLEPNAKPLA